MSLTVGLAILGGLVLAAVLAHSAWVQRRHASRVAAPQDAEKNTHAQRSDPHLQAQTQPTQGSDGLEPSLESAMLRMALAADQWPTLDALIDVIAALVLDEPISGEAAMAVLPLTRRVGSKPFMVEGKTPALAWESLRAGETYSALQAGVQMANRSGALTEIEFSEFVQKVQSYADTVGAVVEFPDMRHEVARAKELDQFASTYDAQLSFTLRAKTVAWSMGYVHQHASRQGFVAGAIAGRMVLPASTAGMPSILSLHFDTQAAMSDDPEQSALRNFDLVLDVAQVDRSQQPYHRLCEIAVEMAATMEGVITDDQGQVISRAAMDAIGADLQQLYDTLESRDLAAGSALARRLFS
jgi:hypothetical protein